MNNKGPQGFSCKAETISPRAMAAKLRVRPHPGHEMPRTVRLKHVSGRGSRAPQTGAVK